MSEDVKSESESKKEDWMNSKWRPMMGWMYMLICTFDMVVFPVLWSLLQTVTHTSITQWNPLTLQGAGLFHIAMGAVLGIAAFGRTQEKLGGANNGGAAATPGFPAPTATSPGFSSPAPVTNSFGSQPLGNSFSSPRAEPSFGGGFATTTAAPSFGGAPSLTASGKKIVPDEQQPIL